MFRFLTDETINAVRREGGLITLVMRQPGTVAAGAVLERPVTDAP